MNMQQTQNKNLSTNAMYKMVGAHMNRAGSRLGQETRGMDQDTLYWMQGTGFPGAGYWKQVTGCKAQDQAETWLTSRTLEH